MIKPPEFRRDGDITRHHYMVLHVLGFLEDTEGPKDRLAEAERRLAQAMPDFTFGRTKVEVGPGKYKTAGLVFLLYQLHLQRGGRGQQFCVGSDDLWMILSFMTDAVVDDAKANPGKHAFIDYVLERFEKRKELLISIELAAVA
jgi:hypothetical protein